MPQRKGNAFKFNPKVASTILKTLRLGNFRQTAAGAAGITYQTMMNWLKRGEKNETKALAKFAVDVVKAEEEAEAVMVGTILKAGQKAWQANAWLLARRGHGRWAAPATKLEHTGADGAPLPAAGVPTLVLMMPDSDDLVEKPPAAPDADPAAAARDE